MLRFFNSHGKTLQEFTPANSDQVAVFTCGPSVYQQSHIGNHRTFLFEDIVVRYLIFSGYRVTRGMTVTDVEDKAILEAEKESVSLETLTQQNLNAFLAEIGKLRMLIPDQLPRASRCIEETVSILKTLMVRGHAYEFNGNIYFDPLTFPTFGSLFGLDMSTWPRKKVRFHRDTYPGMRWNRGDFILWHRFRERDPGPWWETEIGRGRPSWNIQDPSMIIKSFHETLSIYCGGIDNLFRHHDYSRAILESIRPYPMAKYWLHCRHLLVNGQKMSKSKGNIIYIDTLTDKGYDISTIRTFLIGTHYRKPLNYSEKRLKNTEDRLHRAKAKIRNIEERIPSHYPDGGPDQRLKRAFIDAMDNDLNTGAAISGLFAGLERVDTAILSPEEASGIINALKEMDTVLQILFI